MNWANEQDARAQIESLGIVVKPGTLEIRPDGNSVRCLVTGMGAEKRGWYRLSEWVMDSGTTMLVGTYGVFQGDDAGTRKIELTKCCDECGFEMGLKEKKCPKCESTNHKNRELTREQKDALRAKQAEDKKRADAERSAQINRAASWAGAVWRKCREAAPADHDYFARKHLASTGGARIFDGNDGLELPGASSEDYIYLGKLKGALVVPMCNTSGKVFGLQFILSREIHKERIARIERDKEFWPAGMSAEAKYFMVGGTPNDIGLICEGYATGISLQEATGRAVAIAFTAGNLGKVAREIKKHYRKQARYLVCADDDWLQKCVECKKYTPVETDTCTHCGKPHKKINAGVARATETALAVPDCGWVKPQFSTERPTDKKGPTDFNDLHCLEGLNAVRAQIEARVDALGWIASAPALVERGLLTQGEGEPTTKAGRRKNAQSIMPLDEIVERFIPLDDGTGKYVFDTWTNKVAMREQMVVLLPAGVRGDDIKRDHTWITRGAFYLDQVGFDPAGDDSMVKLNTWQGWPYLPKEGKCEYILELLRYLCSDDPNSAVMYQWLLCWIAYPLQNPGAKMASAVIMHGPQGTGKSAIFSMVLAKIYGDYATILNQKGLEDKFNSDWSDSKLFLLAEEVVTRAEMWHIKNELKELVTGEWIRINPKNIAAYRQRNHINIVYLSNEDMPLPIDNDDRRHAVIYTPQALEEAFYDQVFKEIENGGVAAFYDYLLRLDLSDFHPKKRPPMTEAKQDLIYRSLPTQMVFLNEWKNGEIYLDHNEEKSLPFCPCLGSDLFAAFMRWTKKNGYMYSGNVQQFIGPLSKLPGWSAGKAIPTYNDLNRRERINRKMVVPSETDMAAAAKMNVYGADLCPPTGKMEWLTSSFNKFRLALPGNIV